MCNITFNLKDDVLIVRIEGQISPAEIFDTVRKSIPISKPREIWDMRKAEFTEMTAADVDRITHIKKNLPYQRDQQVALVAENDFEYGMCRMSSILFEVENLPSKVQAFRSMEEAYRWLGLDPDLPVRNDSFL